MKYVVDEKKVAPLERKQRTLPHNSALVNVYVDLVVFTRIDGTL